MLVESLEPIEEDVQGELELELELVVAAWANRGTFVVRPSGGDLDDVRMLRGQLAEHGCPHVGLSAQMLWPSFGPARGCGPGRSRNRHPQAEST